MPEPDQVTRIQSLNPATRELLGEVAVTTPEALKTAIARAKSSQLEWGATSLKTRAEILVSLRKAMAREGKSLARLIANETGKTEWEGWIEVLQTMEHFRTVTASGPNVLKTERRSAGILKTKRAFVNYLPHGVAGIISPWNYPLILTVGPIVEALMAGNGVVVKPSEWTPLVGKAIEKLFAESRLPTGLTNFIYGFSEVGSGIVDSPDIDLICFTGSVPVGRKIAERCGQLLKPVILELGGNDPLIVLEDAYLERAANAAVWGGFTNAGQTCISVERVIVVESVADEFIQLLKKKTARLRVGTHKKKNDVGAIINERQRDLILKQIQDAGDQPLIGGKNLEADLGGWFIEPCVLEVDAMDATVVNTETFGPVITVIRVKDEEEALAKANGTEYGLNASVFTRDLARGRRLARRIRSGSVCINDVLSNYLCTHLPFGGMGISGIGRVHGPEGLKSFSQIQAVCEDRFSMKKELWWYPVSRKTQALFRFFIRRFYG